MAIKNPWPNIKDLEINDNTTLSSSMINAVFEFIKDQEVTVEKTGSVVNFKNCNTDPFIKVICIINLTQTGTGDPSPSNPRPITGYSTITVHVSDETYPISLGQTICSGELNVTTGELTVDYVLVDLGSLTWVNNGTYSNTFNGTLIDVAGNTTDAICSNYKLYDSTTVTTVDYGFALASSLRYVYVKDINYTVASDFKTAMSGVYMAYKLSTPATYQLTPTEIDSLIGENNVYHDGNGDMTVKYKTTIRCLMNQ